MKEFIIIAAGVLVTTPSFAQEAPKLEDYLWKNRPIVVFADTPEDARFKLQMNYLESRMEELEDRDVVILTDTNPSEKSALREALHPRGFSFVLIGKDGGVKLRKPSPWTVREIIRTIDKMPMRQQEMGLK